MKILSIAGCTRVLVETVGVGQTEAEVVQVADLGRAVRSLTRGGGR